MNMENNVKLSDSEIIKYVHGMQKKRKIIGVIDAISTLWIVLGILVVVSHAFHLAGYLFV